MDKLILGVIFLLLPKVFSKDTTTETGASGDGEEGTSITSSVTMIDDNENILGSSINPFLLNSTLMDSEKGLDTTLNDSTIAETTMQSATTTTRTTMITTEATTTETPTTTVSTTTTEALSTTTTTPTTTPTFPETTTLSTTVKSTNNLQMTSTASSLPTEENGSTLTTTSDIPQVSTVRTTYVPENEGKLCFFMDSNFMCDAEIVCYGEGEIDCSEEEDIPPPSKTTFTEKVSFSSISEDYLDYEGTIETFPPSLVGIVSQKKRYPFLFKMGSIGTTDMTSDIYSATTKKESSSSSETVPVTEAMQSTGQVKTTISLGVDFEPFNISDKAKETTNAEISMVTVSSSDATEEHTEQVPSTSEVNIMATILDTVTPTQGPATTVEYMTSHALTITEDISAATLENSSEKSLNLRRKRDDKNILLRSKSPSSSVSETFHMAALESIKQKIQVKSCKIIGNLRCSPAPSTAMCKGKTYCQVVSSTAETSEKSTSAKGVENWAIAVIAICAIAAALTVSLLVYLVVTSWKKLKVQPQNGVTTLTYVNNTQP